MDTDRSREITEEHIMKMNVKNEIKALIVRTGLTEKEVAERLAEKYGRSSSASNLSNKLARETLRFIEAVEIADVLGYDLEFVKRK